MIGTREFVAAMFQGFLAFVDILGSREYREDPLFWFYPGGSSDCFPERKTHPLRNTVGPCPGGLFVFTEHMMRVYPQFHVEVRPAYIFHQAPVYGDTGRLQVLYA